jgi:hypothetical protein
MSTDRTGVAAAEGGTTRLRTALTWEPPLQHLAALVRSTPFLAAILVVATFPIISFLPRSGPDPSWQAGLYLALEGGLQFGRDFVFTYGPLGFLHAPVLYGEGLFLVSAGFSIGIRYLLAASLFWTARRAVPLPLALVACYVILVVGHLNSVLILVAFLWTFAAVGPAPPRHADKVLAIGGGFLAAVELLGKLNYGVSIFALCLVALVALPRRRRSLGLYGSTFVASLLALWLLTGQALSNLPAYLSNSVQLVSGYSRAMGIDLEPRSPEIALSLAAAAILLVATAVLTRRDRRVLRWASLLILTLFAFVCFKQDFIRRGIEGRGDFSLMMAAAAIAVATRIPAGGRLPKAGLAAALLAPMLLLVVWASPTPSFIATLSPQEHLVFFREDMTMIANPAKRHAERDFGKGAIRAAYAVPPSILHRLGGRSVAIEPWEIGVAWAYGLNWKPLPVIQDYSVYTPALDRLNAAALSGDGPQMMLRQDLRGGMLWTIASVNSRYPAWDGPAAKLALLCNYREVESQGEWQLLKKTADRCGPVRPLRTARTETGAAISVPRAPAADEIVFARIDGLEPDLAESIKTLAYRGPGGWASFDGRGKWNLDIGTAADGSILSAPADVDYRRPFQLAPDAKTFRVGIDGAGPRPITVSFYSQAIEPRPVRNSPRAADSR